MKTSKEIQNMNLQEINSELETVRKHLKILSIKLKSGIAKESHQKKQYKSYIARLLTFKQQLSK